MVANLDSFWWEDTNCLVPKVQDKTVATICQYDTAADSTTTTTTTTEATIGYDESAATELMTTFLDQVNLIVILI